MNDVIDEEKFKTFLTNAFKNISYFLKKGGAFYIWFMENETKNFYDATMPTDLLIKETLIWVKNNRCNNRKVGNIHGTKGREN